MSDDTLICDRCGEQHRRPSQPFSAWLGTERDGDGQLTTIHVGFSNCAHVSEVEAEWVREALRQHARAVADD